jgi:hypothetical protein|tara:strand:+ start:766 stop:927 length:162 start_codon:yes stop_codon:yes gene_type:complete
MTNKKYIDFEVWKKLNKDKTLDIKTKSIDESIKDAKKDLFCENINHDKNDKDV